jgi:L-alanine-DL-glutamate epimerase-like enolase superfamily enzyme
VFLKISAITVLPLTSERPELKVGNPIHPSWWGYDQALVKVDIDEGISGWGTAEQHGPHLPVKMDSWSARSIAHETATHRPDRLLVMPSIHYGYTTHVMDFPGSITVHQSRKPTTDLLV